MQISARQVKISKIFLYIQQQFKMMQNMRLLLMSGALTLARCYLLSEVELLPQLPPGGGEEVALLQSALLEATEGSPAAHLDTRPPGRQLQSCNWSDFVAKGSYTASYEFWPSTLYSDSLNHWSHFFEWVGGSCNTDYTNYSNCKVYETCSSTTESSQVFFQSHYFRAYIFNMAAYDVTVGLKCYNYAMLIDGIYEPNWPCVQVNVKLKSCADPTNLGTSVVTVDFNAVPGIYDRNTTVSTFFQDDPNYACTIESCIAKKQSTDSSGVTTCSTSTSDVDSGVDSTGEFHPAGTYYLSIYAFTSTSTSGYTSPTNYCFQCTYSSGNVLVQQFGYVLRPCTEHAINTISVIPSVSINTYYSSYQDPRYWAYYGRRYDFAKYLFVSKSDQCSPQGCWMKDQGCTQNYTGSLFDTAFQVTNLLQYNRTFPQSDTVTVCIACEFQNGVVEGDITVVYNGCNDNLNPKSSSAILLNYDFEFNGYVDESYKNFYQLSLGANCAVDNCKYYQEDCTTLIQNSTMIKWDESLKLPNLIIYKNESNEYVLNMCAKCENLKGGQVSQALTITQAGCDTLVTNQNLITNFNLDYAPGCSSCQDAIIAKWDTFFSDTHAESKCNPVSCEVREADCVTAPTSNSVFTADDIGKVYALKNIVEGYNLNLCLWCTNGARDISNAFTVTQSTCIGQFTENTVFGGTYSLDFDNTQTAMQTYYDYLGAFNIANSHICPVTSCTMLESDCTTTLDSSYVGVMAVTPWSMQGLVNIKAGYTKTVCYKCSSSVASGTRQVVYTQNPCTSTMNKQTQATIWGITNNDDVVTPYSHDPAVTDLPIITKWDQIFTISSTSLHSSYCAFSSCKLMQQDCTTDYAGSNFIFNDVAGDYNLKAKRNIIEGYEETICYSCTDDAQTVAHTFKVTQKSCLSLTNNASPSSTGMIIEYNHGGTASSIVNTQIYTDQFFTNSEPVNCPYTLCEIKENDCTTTFTSSYLTLRHSGIMDNFQMKDQVNLGYDYTVCFKCSNGVQTVQIADLKFQQKSCHTLTLKANVPTEFAVEYSHDPAITTSTIFTTWSDAFENSNTGNCPVTSCEGKTSDCSATMSTNLVSVTNMKLEMSVREVNGFQSSICYTCTNGIQTATKTLTLTQKSCANTLSLKASLPSNQEKWFSPTPVAEALVASIDEIFDNSNAVSCPITSCSLFAHDCSTPITDGSMTMAAESPFAITMERNKAGGYIKTPCISCTNRVQTITWTTWRVKLVSCGNQLSVNSVVPGTRDYGFDLAAPPEKIGEGWTSFFTNAQPTNCPITECRLLTAATSSTCTTDLYTGTEITVESTSPFQMHALKNVPTGFDVTVCFQCENTEGQFETVLQRVQAPDCSNTLSLLQSSVSVELLFDISDTSFHITDQTELLSNTLPSKCPVTSCVLKDQSCDATYSRQIALIGSASPWILTTVRNVVSGIGEQLCYSCTNDAQTVNVDITINMVDCESALVVADEPIADQLYRYQDSGTHTIGDYNQFFKNTGCREVPDDWVHLEEARLP